MISERFDGMIAARDLDRPFRLGILGGTFDPVHIGHLHIAASAKEQYFLDGILFIPTGMPVRKLERGYTDGKHRVAALRLAIADEPTFDVSTIEIERTVATYTIDTLEAIAAHYAKHAELFFIAGADTASDMHTWKDAAKIATMVQVLCAKRTDANNSEHLAKRNENSIKAGFKIDYLQTMDLDISSLELREHIKNGLSADYLIPKKAYDYILEHELYK